MEELLEEIQNIQNYLYGGYKNEGATNLDWLDLLSSKFFNVFKLLHKFLIVDITATNKTTVIEQCFLCANQIIVCLKFLEKTVHKEIDVGCLITSRQCFYERILWCLARLKSTVKSANDDVFAGIAEPENFISLLDDILCALSPFVALNSDNIAVNNKAAQRAELMMESSEIRGSIEQLLSHAMAFANIAVESDKNPLTALSANLLKTAIEFEEEFSLAQPGKKVDISSQRIKAIELESSLYSLENFVNDALLRLVFEVFHVLDGNVIDNLKKTKDLDILEEEIEKFDLLVDRLIQIGHFAIWFSRDNQKISSVVRSCVASIESLDSYLVPAITSSSDPSNDVLQAHFEEEARSMQNHVQQIIDTKAFCLSLMEQLNIGIEVNKVNFDKESLMNLVYRSNVLLDHFQINTKSLELSKDKVAKFYFSDFKLILTECEAILNFPEEIEDFERRAIKRFKILSSTIRKLQNAIKNLQKSDFDDDELKSSKQEKFMKASDFPSKCSDYFNTIRPSALGSILYESKRSIKNPSKSQNASKLATSSVRRSSKKRRSLRIAIFKKHHDFEAEDAWHNDDEKFNETMDLQITEILDKLTDLSTTLTQKSKAN